MVGFHSIPVRQLIYAFNPHKRELNVFSPVSHTTKSRHCFMFIYVGGRGGTKAAVYMSTKWRLLYRARRKNCQGVFSFLSFHR